MRSAPSEPGDDEAADSSDRLGRAKTLAGDAPTLLRAAIVAEHVSEITSAAFIQELGPSSEASEQRAATLVGTLISGRYRVDEIVGQGGMGAVFRGEQIHLQKRVAIKVLHPDTERVPGLIERFEHEAVAGAHVHHPNVAAAIDFGKLDDGSYFLVLEYIEGTPLSTLLDAGPLEPARALRIARQMAGALAAVHEKGIVHRDVKPQNTLLGEHDHVTIIDFGLAKVDILSATGRKPNRPEVVLTAAGVVFGTPAYLAPEAALGMAAVDARSDLYALGVTLYEMLCARQPFEGRDAVSLFRQQRLDDAPALRLRAPEVTVPPQAERIAMRLLQRNPAHRYQTAEEVIAAIDEALAALERAGPPEPPPRWSTMGLPGPASVRPSLGPGAAERGAGGSTRPVFTGPVPRWVVGATAVGSLVLGGLVAMIVRSSPHPTHAVASATPSAPPSPTSAHTASPFPSPTPAPFQSPAPTPTTAPSVPASSTSAAPHADDLDVTVARSHLDKATQIKDWVMGAKALLTLARLEPALLDDQDTRNEAIAVTAGIAHEGRSELSDAIFDVLGVDLGSRGLDVLYELALSRGGTKGGQRARAILARSDVFARESPALRIAFQFFVGSCVTRRALLERAAAEGDRRTLVQLEGAHSARCSNPRDPCCFHDDAAMADAIMKLRARLEN